MCHVDIYIYACIYILTVLRVCDKGEKRRREGGELGAMRICSCMELNMTGSDVDDQCFG